MHLYSAFCVLWYTQSALKSCGGSLLNHHQCAAPTWMMRRLPQDYGASALTTHQLQVERRERDRANQVDRKSLTPVSHCKRKQGVSSAYFFRPCKRMRAFTQHAGAARQRVAGAEQERQCRDRFGGESIFAALLMLN